MIFYSRCYFFKFGSSDVKMKIGFNHEKYLEEQSKYILERVNNHDKLYIEFGGKLLGDLHAKRVLPGFDVQFIMVINSFKYIFRLFF